jgi:hypothetical protein
VPSNGACGGRIAAPSTSSRQRFDLPTNNAFNLKRAASTARVRVRETDAAVPIRGAPLPVTDVYNVDEMWERLDSHVDECRSLEVVVRRLVDIVYERIASTAVLVRLSQQSSSSKLAPGDRSLVNRPAHSAIDSIAFTTDAGADASRDARSRSGLERPPAFTGTSGDSVALARASLGDTDDLATARGDRLHSGVARVRKQLRSESTRERQRIFYVQDAGSAVDELGRKIRSAHRAPQGANRAPRRSRRGLYPPRGTRSAKLVSRGAPVHR